LHKKEVEKEIRLLERANFEKDQEQRRLQNDAVSSIDSIEKQRRSIPSEVDLDLKQTAI